MKKILLLTSVFLLASCANQGTQNNNTGSVNTGTVVQSGSTHTTNTGTTQSNNEDTQETAEWVAIETGSHVKLYYTLRDTDEKGEILDTNILEDAISIWKASSGETLEPLPAIIGTRGLIPGFEKAIIGMKKGETKSFTVSPEEGYGTGTTVADFPKNTIAPVFDMAVPKEVLEGTVKRTLNRDELPEWFKEKIETAKVGDVITEKEGFEGKILELTDKTVTVAIKNSASPFLGKELKVGAESTQDGITYKITKIDGDFVTLEVHNPNSPFTQENFKAGTVVENKKLDGNAPAIPYIKILDITDDGVKVEYTNKHSLANKQLFFFVKVADVSNTQKSGPSILPVDAQ